MSGLLEDREHAAEALFAHDEELRFLALRRAIESLSAWATEAVGMTGEAAARYESKLIDAYLSGIAESEIVMVVQNDLERAGKPALSTTAVTVFASALAAATDALHGRSASPYVRHGSSARHLYHPMGASLSWRD